MRSFDWSAFHERRAARFREVGTEARRLSRETTSPEVRESLDHLAKVQEQHARRAEGEAIEALYGHLYEDVGA